MLAFQLHRWRTGGNSEQNRRRTAWMLAAAVVSAVGCVAGVLRLIV